MQEDIKKLLFDEFGLDGLTDENRIFSSNLLDSMDVLRLISALEKNYKIDIPAFSVTIEMFDTIDSISSLVRERREQINR